MGTNVEHSEHDEGGTHVEETTVTSSSTSESSGSETTKDS
jgi:hypothetical protein